MLHDVPGWRFHFDCRARQLVIERRYRLRRSYWQEAVHPLTQVVAVQLPYGGSHTYMHTSTEPCQGGMQGQYFTYEMNLILDNRQQPRLHLCAHSDWQWMRREGQRLADFLGVPVVDQLAHGA